MDANETVIGKQRAEMNSAETANGQSREEAVVAFD
jgi:hypothetical protein